MEQEIGATAGIIYILIMLIMIISFWKIFEKAGEPGWKSIIPIYNFFVLLQIVGRPAWWFILLFIPLVNFIILIIIYHKLSLSFGKDVGFTIGLVLLGFIFIPILGFGKDIYVGPGGEAFNPQTNDDVLDDDF